MKKSKIGWYVIGSAIIWGLTGILLSLQLRDTDCFDKIGLIFGSATGIHLILIWGPLAAQLKKKQEENDAEVGKKE
ncbi:MAG: hypothetical protein APR54_09340 [Candidatus Cloacimonas sp. SDB]|nr:MAG: hypothetical protein APR54_09340 [Candidatus Cloacimonas sp. SDB]